MRDSYLAASKGKSSSQSSLLVVQTLLSEIAIAGTALSPAGYGRVIQGGLTGDGCTIGNQW